MAATMVRTALSAILGTIFFIGYVSHAVAIVQSGYAGSLCSFRMGYRSCVIAWIDSH